MSFVQQPTESDQKVMAIAPKIPALIGLVSSMCVIASFYRSPGKWKKMYHRLVLTMSCYGVVQCIVFIIGTIAFPSDTPHTFLAYGNIYSCVTQGIVTQLTVAIPMYYTSLSIYCYVAIKNDFKQEKIVWIEPWIHWSIHIFLLISVLFPLITNNINPQGPVCYIQSYPESCGRNNDVTCIRGDGKLSYLFHYIFLATPAFSCMTIVPVTMFLIFRIQKRKDNQKAQGKQVVIASARKKKSRIVLLQASMFTMAYYISYILNIVHRAIMSFKGTINYKFWAAGASMIPLQNFFFTLVYFGLQSTTTDDERRLIDSSYTATLRARLQQKSEDTSIPMEENRNTGTKRRFTIFDGSVKTSSPWIACLIDDDDSDCESQTNDDTDGYNANPTLELSDREL